MKINNNRIALITGAAGGIGSEIAKKMSLHADSLILIDIDEEKTHNLKLEIEKNSKIPFAIYNCDISDSALVKNTLKQAEVEIGLPNIIINNAGFGGPFLRIDEVTDELWFKIIYTNLKGLFNICRIVLPIMKQQNYGKIINIASTQGYLGAALSSTYVASKHGVIGYTRSIAAEWGAYGITCNAICPGYVETNMGIQSDQIDKHLEKVIGKTPSGRIAKPYEIADLVVHLTKDESSFINGSILTIDGGLTCHLGL